MPDSTPNLDDLISRHLPQLVRLLDDSTLSELEVALGELRVTLRRSIASASVVAATLPSSVPISSGSHREAIHEEQTAIDEGHQILAPMVGTFYTAPSPGAPPFVQEGDVVELGQVIGIIEAMKVINEIEAEVSGRVLRIVAQNQQPVEYGQTLLIVAPV